MKVGTVCTAGHYCPESSANPSPCPIGTYNKQTGLTQSAECAECPNGYACPSEGL